MAMFAAPNAPETFRRKLGAVEHVHEFPSALPVEIPDDDVVCIMHLEMSGFTRVS